MKSTLITLSVLVSILITNSGIVQAQAESVEIQLGDSLETSPDQHKKKSKVERGIASYYSDKFQGRKTANGDIFDQKKFTAAHNKVPFGTWLKVTNPRNKKWVYVRVNDRMSKRNTRIVDLSKVAAKELGMLKAGIIRVEVVVLGKKDPNK